MLTLRQLENLASGAGYIVRAAFEGLHDPERTISAHEKSDGTLVTAVDIKINNKLARDAHALGLGFVGEEGNGRKNREYVILADPIDGTTAFTRGMNTATVILTLMHMRDGRGHPLMAVIYEPLTGRMWSTNKQSKVHFQMRGFDPRFVTLHHHAVGTKIRSNICVWPGAGYNLGAVRDAMLADCRFEDQQMGAVGISAGLIALGMLDLCLYGPSSAVEAAAMSLIVQNAGGIACNLRGEPLTEGFAFGEVRGKPDFELPNGALFAANQAVADIALECIRQHN